MCLCNVHRSIAEMQRSICTVYLSWTYAPLPLSRSRMDLLFVAVKCDPFDDFFIGFIVVNVLHRFTVYVCFYSAFFVSCIFRFTFFSNFQWFFQIQNRSTSIDSFLDRKKPNQTTIDTIDIVLAFFFIFSYVIHVHQKKGNKFDFEYDSQVAIDLPLIEIQIWNRKWKLGRKLWMASDHFVSVVGAVVIVVFLFLLTWWYVLVTCSCSKCTKSFEKRQKKKWMNEKQNKILIRSQPTGATCSYFVVVSPSSLFSVSPFSMYKRPISICQLKCVPRRRLHRRRACNSIEKTAQIMNF